ncbi:MAG TPA: sensor histidine kinase [Pseudonocardiaceae bacterium]
MRAWHSVLRSLRQVEPIVADAALAAVLALFGIADLARPLPAGSAGRPADALGYALVIALCAPLVLRRRAPRLTVALVMAAAAVLSVVGYRQSPMGLPVVVALFTLGRLRELRRSVSVLVLVVAVLALSYVESREPISVADLGTVLMFTVAAWWLGASIRGRRAEAARQAIAAERLRIARELHDVVAHSMSVVAVQSGVAAHVMDARPEQAKAALQVIATTSRAALDELRRLLDVLRPDGESAGSLAPAPGLTQVPELADQFTEAGMPVRLRLESEAGEPAELPAAADLTAYRIVQEALTNAFKHAGQGARVDVLIAHRDGAVTIEVVDDGGGLPAPQPTGASAGLVGMRERVALFGGTLEVGPVGGSGWRVSASLPLPDVGPGRGRTHQP